MLATAVEYPMQSVRISHSRSHSSLLNQTLPCLGLPSFEKNDKTHRQQIGNHLMGLVFQDKLQCCKLESQCCAHHSFVHHILSHEFVCHCHTICRIPTKVPRQAKSFHLLRFLIHKCNERHRRSC